MPKLDLAKILLRLRWGIRAPLAFTCFARDARNFICSLGPMHRCLHPSACHGVCSPEGELLYFDLG